MRNQVILERLNKLRSFMKKNGLDAFIIPSTDAHLSEYPPTHWESRVWISGFTGSAGTIVVTASEAGLWTDSRYFLQAEEQLEGTSIQLFKEGLPTTPSFTQWLIDTLPAKSTVGIDGNVYIAQEAINLKSDLDRFDLRLNVDNDPFSVIWEDRPILPENPIFVLPEEYTGESAQSKIQRINQKLKKEGANSIIVDTLDTIAWIFNIRGNDVKCNPVAVAYAYISASETVLFINPKKVTTEVAEYLKNQGVILAEYYKFFDYISRLDEKICVDLNKVTFKILDAIKDKNTLLFAPSPIDLIKSCKNDVELKGFRSAMHKDGVALVRFFMWLEKAVNNGIEEIDIPAKLIEFRSKQDLFVGESFDTISGYGPNGAIVHYHVTKESSAKIKPEGLLLIDSGAQYFDGTTDITRTVAVGPLTEQMKKDYTLVLKGHIAIATAIYPQGTRGSQLDILARKALWNEGLNYLHGTGHGIGHFLNVHEGPQNIRLNENPTTLQIGMVTSNEPGLYRDGEYGIRLENLVATKKEMTTNFGDFYSFETLTLCPFDTRPIVKELLTKEEVEWFNKYHKMVFDELSPLLDTNEKEWLKNKTHAI